jgi:hypothetical protein
MDLSVAQYCLTIGFAVAVLTVAGADTGSSAASRKPNITKAPHASQQQTVKLRYYGGPKSPMYP